MAIDVYIDGRLMDDPFVDAGGSHVVRGAPVSPTATQAFTFARIKVSDGEFVAHVVHLSLIVS